MSYTAERRSNPQSGVTAEITPSDEDDLADEIVGVNVAVAGDVAFEYLDGSSGALYCPAGSSSLFGVVSKILATGTTATGLRGIKK